ncbi:hypothetical protein GJ496_006627 [Pomphorhynchus laevis]|nr:hypothetical protein GJ496_006627 [Pomphorhynchus laevis]
MITHILEKHKNASVTSVGDHMRYFLVATASRDRLFLDAFLLIGIFLCCGFISSSALAVKDTNQPRRLKNNNIGQLLDVLFKIYNINDLQIKSEIGSIVMNKINTPDEDVQNVGVSTKTTTYESNETTNDWYDEVTTASDDSNETTNEDVTSTNDKVDDQFTGVMNQAEIVVPVDNSENGVEVAVKLTDDAESKDIHDDNSETVAKSTEHTQPTTTVFKDSETTVIPTEIVNPNVASAEDSEYVNINVDNTNSETEKIENVADTDSSARYFEPATQLSYDKKNNAKYSLLMKLLSHLYSKY